MKAAAAIRWALAVLAPVALMTGFAQAQTGRTSANRGGR